MGKKLYFKSETGIKFKSSRKPGEVRIPNYVYDLWVPVLGAETIGVYAVYCRLEREGTVKGMSMLELARACRIGKSKLQRINKDLERCDFIKVTVPMGQAKLMHWTNEIEILDPPREVSQALATELLSGREHELLAPWLMEEDEETEPPTVPNGTAGEPNQDRDTVLNGNANIESLGLQPSDIDTNGIEQNSPTNDPSFLPDSKTQLDILFPEHCRGIEQQLIDFKAANWQPGEALEFGLAHYLKATGQVIPSNKKEREDWIKDIGEHITDYGQSELPWLYPDTVKKMRANNWNISRPGSLTKTMRGVYGERKNNDFLPPTPAFQVEARLNSAPDELQTWWLSKLPLFITQFGALHKSEALARDNGRLRVLITQRGRGVIEHLDRGKEIILRNLDGVQDIEFVKGEAA